MGTQTHMHLVVNFGHVHIQDIYRVLKKNDSYLKTKPMPRRHFNQI